MIGGIVLETESEAEKVDIIVVGYWCNKHKDIVVTRYKYATARRNNNGTIRVRSIPVLRIIERRIFVNCYGQPIEPTVFPGFDRSNIFDPRETDIRPGSYYRYGRGQTVYVAAIERCIEIAGQPSRHPWAVLQFENGDLMTSSLLSLARIGFTREPN